MTPAQPPLFTTRGVAHELGCSIAWVHRLVKERRIAAYVYTKEGELVPRSEPHQGGESLFYYKKDIDAFKKHRRSRGRPKGSPNKEPRKKKIVMHV